MGARYEQVSMNDPDAVARGMYGMTTAAMEEHLTRQAKLVGWGMLCMSILSDVQHVLALGDRGPGGMPATLEDSRVFLNRAKWVLVHKVAQKDEHGRML